MREPISTVPNQTYGEAAQQQAAQRAVPMAPSAAPAPSQMPAPPGAQDQHAAANQPQGQVYPGELPWTGPTQRPNEPVTAGLPTGPGPGPEALTGVGAAGFGHASTAQLLNSLAQIPGATRDVQDLANYAAQMKA